MNDHRRRLMQALAAAGAAAGLSGRIAIAASAEPPPETTRIRLPRAPSACLAPQYVAEDLLRAEGFNEIEYIGTGLLAAGLPGAQQMGAGEIDVGMNFAAPLVVAVDMGAPIVVLAGVHAGCFELFANERVRTIKDLKGKTVSILARNSGQHIFLASIAASVGIDPNRDIRWVDHPPAEGKRLLAEGGIDAYLGFPPDPQELRAKKVGRLLLNSAVDRPWSQYFCCLIAANREWAARHPVAARRAVRAILKGSELCAADPELGAKAFLDQGFNFDPEHARQALRELPYGRWRDYNPEETIRFYALRLREAEMVKGSPQKIIASGTDWRIVDRLRKELKA
jgi:NitT/TauT family transport system substrate-binding protein